MIEHIAFGWSLGALSMIVFDSLWDSWVSYRKDLRAAKCGCSE